MWHDEEAFKPSRNKDMLPSCGFVVAAVNRDLQFTTILDTNSTLKTVQMV